MKLKYGSQTFEIHPSFAPSLNFKSREGDNEASTIEETWNIDGSFKKDGWSNLVTEWDAIIAALRVPAQDFAILDESDVTVFQLLAADCINGPTCHVLNVTEKHKGFMVTNIKFQLRITAEYVNPDAPTDLRGKIDFSFQFNSMGFMTITENGVAKGTNITTPPSPWLSPTTVSFEFDSRFDLSRDRTECKYMYKWKERKVALPPGLYNLVSSFSLNIDEQNADDFLYNIIRVSGDCQIKRKDTAESIWNKTGILSANPDSSVKRPVAADFIPVESIDDLDRELALMQVKDWIDNNLIGKGVKILSKEINARIYEQRITFNFQILKPESVLAKYDYSVTIKENAVKTSIVPVFNRTPVVQRIGYTHSEITERGEVVFFDGRPPHPSPYWPEICTSPSVSYPKPVVGSDQEIALGSMRFSFTYQKSEFTFLDVLRLVSQRTSDFAIPIPLW